MCLLLCLPAHGCGAAWLPVAGFLQISKVQTSCVHIMRMVGAKEIFEKEIRSALGNNPDTSKALRL